MRRLAAILSAASLIATLAGCHGSTPPPAQLSLQELQAQYAVAFKEYQAACFPGESAAAVSDALHGPRPAAPAATPPPAPTEACMKAKARADSFDAPLRAAMNAQGQQH